MLVCNGLFPRTDKNQREYFGAFIEVSGVSYWTRLDIRADGVWVLTLSRPRQGGGFDRAGSYAASIASNVFSFDIEGHKLQLVPRRVKREPESPDDYPVGTVFFGTFEGARPATQADVLALLGEAAPAADVSDPVPTQPAPQARSNRRSRRATSKA